MFIVIITTAVAGSFFIIPINIIVIGHTPHLRIPSTNNDLSITYLYFTRPSSHANKSQPVTAFPAVGMETNSCNIGRWFRESVRYSNTTNHKISGWIIAWWLSYQPNALATSPYDILIIIGITILREILASYIIQKPYTYLVLAKGVTQFANEIISFDPKYQSLEIFLK